jgi:hybrid cluster-associated redox disulfide protein
MILKNFQYSTVNHIHKIYNWENISYIMTKLTSEHISKEILISDLADKYPDTIPILIENGMHCIGCGASMFETLEEGFQGHGMNDEEIKRIMIDINRHIEENSAKKHG